MKQTLKFKKKCLLRSLEHSRCEANAVPLEMKYIYRGGEEMSFYLKDKEKFLSKLEEIIQSPKASELDVMRASTLSFTLENVKDYADHVAFQELAVKLLGPNAEGLPTTEEPEKRYAVTRDQLYGTS